MPVAKAATYFLYTAAAAEHNDDKAVGVHSRLSGSIPEELSYDKIVPERVERCKKSEVQRHKIENRRRVLRVSPITHGVDSTVCLSSSLKDFGGCWGVAFRIGKGCIGTCWEFEVNAWRERDTRDLASGLIS